MPAATSNYRQVRLTVTEEPRGRLSVRVMVKRPDQSWSIKDTVWHHSWTRSRPTGHWLTLLGEAFHMIAGEALPPPE